MAMIRCECGHPKCDKLINSIGSRGRPCHFAKGHRKHYPKPNAAIAANRGRMQSQQERDARSAVMKGRTPTPQALQAAIAANTGRSMPTHVREALLIANVGRKHSEEHTERRRVSLRIAMKGKKPAQSTIDAAHTPDARAKLSRALKGKPKPWMVQILTGRSLSLKTRQKISAALSGRPLPKETAEKISIAMKGRFPDAAHAARTRKKLAELLGETGEVVDMIISEDELRFVVK